VRVKSFKWQALILVLAVAIPASAQSLFDVKPVADGVWVAIAKPHRPENCNSAIILLKDSVLVVDTAATPSSGRELVREIKKLTDKPVRYVVNTHFHWDHYWGNEAFVEAWPNVQIISSAMTWLDMQRMGLGNPLIERWKIEIPETIEKWKAALAKSTDEAERAKLQDRITRWGEAVEEFKKMHPALPNVTFERELVLGDGDNRVEIRWPGRGHTPGDTVVYLPAKRVVASGDLLAGDTPYIGVVTPQEWVETLDELGKLDFEYVIPGHGGVIRGKDRLNLWKRYLTDVVAETTRAYEQGASLEEARDKVVEILKSRYASQFPPDFQYAAAGNVTTTYRMISGEPD
jgi:cyclase